MIILSECKITDHLNTQRCTTDRESDEGPCKAKGLSLHGKDGVGTAAQQRSSSVKARTHAWKSVYSQRKRYQICAILLQDTWWNSAKVLLVCNSVKTTRLHDRFLYFKCEKHSLNTCLSGNHLSLINKDSFTAFTKLNWRARGQSYSPMCILVMLQLKIPGQSSFLDSCWIEI